MIMMRMMIFKSILLENENKMELNMQCSTPFYHSISREDVHS